MRFFRRFPIFETDPKAMLDVGIPLCLGAADSAAELLGDACISKKVHDILDSIRRLAAHHRSIKSRIFV
jgi:hypothetical protein